MVYDDFTPKTPIFNGFLQLKIGAGRGEVDCIDFEKALNRDPRDIAKFV
jgi:hypothetical protein